jgi:hypothetical protein
LVLEVLQGFGSVGANLLSEAEYADWFESRRDDLVSGFSGG